MTNDHSDLELSVLLNRLRGDISFYRLAEAVAGEPYAVGEQTLIRLGDYNRPFKTPVAINTLIGAAVAINRTTKERTTPWDMWTAHGIQFERTHDLWGRPRRADLDALPLLFDGWHTLTPPRLATWNRVGISLHAEQAAEDKDAELERLRRENAELRARINTTSTGAQGKSSRN